MKTIFSIFTVIFILCSIQSCKNSTDPKSANLVISGQVMNQDNNTGVAGALITTEPATTTQLTDENGKFVINVDSAGVFVVKAKKAGFSTNSATVKAAQNLSPFALIFIRDVKSFNKPPNKPDYKSPKYNDSTISSTITLSWDCSDPNGDPLTYNVYFGTDNPPQNKIASSINDTKYTVKDLQEKVTYYWKVVAQDPYEETEGDVWIFNTYKPAFDYSNLYAYYQFNGNTTDGGPNNIKGTLYNATYASDRNDNSGSALSLYGSSSSYMSIANNSSVDLNSFTIACWIKPNSNFGYYYDGYFYLVSKWTASGYSDNSFYFGLYASSSYSGYAQLRAGTYDYSYGSTTINSSTYIYANQWTHVAVTFNSSSNSGKLYINGKPDYSGYMRIPQKNSYDILVGKSRYSGGSYFGGSIDEIYIFGRALTDDEIKLLANM